MHPLFHPLYIDFCCYFNGNQDYFQCHEVLEEYWKEIAPRERNHPIVGYIQVATGMYHWRRGNFNGAKRMLQKGAQILKSAKNETFIEKINMAEFLRNIEVAIDSITHEKPFQAFQLPLTDESLIQLVDYQIRHTPPLDEHFIRHKHMLRDRKDIIELRQKNLNASNRS